MRSKRRRSSIIERCDTFVVYWQRARLRPSHVRWWAQGYANSILYGVSGTNIHKLQRMQNTIAQVVKLSRSNTGVMDILKDLHWLPIRYRIDLKIATLVYKVRSSSQPVYLLSLISDYAPIRSLHSTGTHTLHTPRVKTAVGSRAFSSLAPKVWNSLKADIRECITLLTFRRKLETFYSNQAFN